RIVSERLGAGFWRVRARYGFMERPDGQRGGARCCAHGMNVHPAQTTYYLGRAKPLPTRPAPTVRWRKRPLAVRSRDANSATEFFGIPPDRVVELGARIAF